MTAEADPARAPKPDLSEREPDQDPTTEDSKHAVADADADVAEEAAREYELSKYTRQPIVSVLGHVDHGKTSLLDFIRGSTVAAREAGAITQHIGATEVPLETVEERCKAILGSRKFKVPGLLFIDTPGHSAFTSLRSRGGALADIAVVVVDINEGFKPQTKEALSILKASRTPFLIAANKIDLVHGWKSTNAPFVTNVQKQTAEVMGRFDEKFYKLIGHLYETTGRSGDRYDRVQDFTKAIAIVPVSAKTGEGVPDLLMILLGLAQRFLERRLETTETGPALATILEVKEEKGLGVTLDTIVYSGLIRNTDTVLIGTRGEPLRTKVKALLRPKPLEEIRDPRDSFDRVKEVHAAAGIKVLVQDNEDVQSGAPIRVVRDAEHEAELWEELAEAAKPSVHLQDVGIFIKGDTIGSLEALAFELKPRDIPIRRAEVGDISRRDVIEAATAPDPLKRIILAFNVKVLPDAKSEMEEREVAVLTDNVIYTLLEGYEKWYDEAKARLDAAQREEYVHPGMIRFLPDHTFRVNNPAVIGVRVMAGQLQVDQPVMRDDGKRVGIVKSIQKEKQTISKAKQGDEVAIAIDGATVGRQIKEEDILFVDVPEGHAKKLVELKKLNPDEQGVLERIFQIKRKEDKFWGM